MKGKVTRIKKKGKRCLALVLAFLLTAAAIHPLGVQALEAKSMDEGSDGGTNQEPEVNPSLEIKAFYVSDKGEIEYKEADGAESDIKFKINVKNAPVRAILDYGISDVNDMNQVSDWVNMKDAEIGQQTFYRENDFGKSYDGKYVFFRLYTEKADELTVIESRSWQLNFKKEIPVLNLSASSNGQPYDGTNWISGDVTVTLNNSNDKVQEKITFFYKIGGEDPVTPASSGWISMGNENVYTLTENTEKIYFKAETASGLTSGVESFSAKIDKVRPIVSIGEGSVQSGVWFTKGLVKLVNNAGNTSKVKYYVTETIGQENVNPEDSRFWNEVEGGIYKFSDFVFIDKWYYFKAVNEAGLVSEQVVAFNAKIDNKKPEVWVKAYKGENTEDIYNSGSWTNQDTTFQVSGSENPSGISLYYRRNHSGIGDWQKLEGEKFTIPVNQAVNGETVEFKAVSGAGIDSDITAYTLKIDTKAPQNTKLQIRPETPNGTNGWYKSCPSISFEKVIDDGSDVSAYYILQEKGEQAPADQAIGTKWNESPLYLQRGQYIIYYYAQDEMGYRSVMESQEIKVDNVIPGFNVRKTEPNKNEWYDKDVTFTLENNWNTQDQLSGCIYAYQYQVEGGNWSDPVSVSGNKFTVDKTIIEGLGESITSYQLKITAVSGAGITKTGEVIQIQEDKVKPENTQVSKQPELPDGTNGWYKTQPAISFQEVIDDGSDISVYYFLKKKGERAPSDQENGTKWNGNSTPLNIQKGQYVLYYYTQDLAGNRSAIANQEIKVDTETPRFTINRTSANQNGWNDEDVTFTMGNGWNVNEQPSGITYAYRYQVDGNWSEIIPVSGNKFKIDCTVIKGVGESVTSYNVEITAISGAGITKTAEPIQIQEDKVKPENSKVLMFPKTPDGTSGWYKTHPKAEFEKFADNGSPISVYYFLKKRGEKSPTDQEAGTKWLNQVLNVQNGRYIFYFYTQDEAGNRSAISSQAVNVDTGIPEFTVSKTEPNRNGWYQKDVTFTMKNNLDSEKQPSGISYSYRYWVNGKWSASMPIAGSKFTIDETVLKGVGKNVISYEIEITAVSGAGISQVKQIIRIKEDKVKPKNVKVSTKEKKNSSKWYNKLPVVLIDDTSIKNDSGSKVSLYYKLYEKGGEGKETKWKGNNIKIPSQGIWKLEYYTRDEAGNESSHRTETYSADITVPQRPAITYTTKNTSSLAHVINFISFGYFCKEQVQVTVTAPEDDFSGTEKVVYWTTENGKDSKVKTVNENTAVIKLPLGFKGKVNAYCADIAGNKSKTSVSDGVVYENVKGNISITASTDNNKWQNKDITFHVIAQDKQAGLKSVVYTLNGETVYEKNFTDQKYTDITYLNETDITASQEAVDANGYVLIATVTDNAGNVSRKQEKVYIDKTAPVIGLSGIEAGSYSNENRTLSVEVDELIYNYNRVDIHVTRTLDGVTTELEVPEFQSSAKESKQGYDFTEDGLYSVTVTAEDAAGNTAKSQQLSFTIDKTAPEIAVSGLDEGSYHGTDVTAQIAVTESFYDTDNVTISVTKTIDGESGSYNTGTWNNTGKLSQMDASFTEDGTYLIEVNAVDAAGNEAVPQQLTFTVDKTAPEVGISGAGDYYITGNKVALNYEVTESYFDTNQVEISVTREDIDGNVEAVSVGNWSNTGKVSSLTYDFEEDGIYTSVIKSIDKAGNESTVQKVITVDTTNPIIRYVDEINGKYYQSFQLERNVDEMIQDLTVPTYAMTLNGQEYDGMSEISEEGKYVFKMDVSDEVGHMAVASAEFMVDHTPPVLVLNGAEDGMVSYEAVDVSLSLADSDDRFQSISLGGQQQEFDAKQNTFTAKLSETGVYEIAVQALDYAGNKLSQSIQITIADKSALREWIEDKPEAAAAIAGTASVAGVGSCMAFCIRKRKFFIKK